MHSSDSHAPAAARRHPSRQRFITSPRSPLHKGATVKAMAQLMFMPRRYRPSKPLPMCAPDWQRFLGNSAQAQFIWFGHSSLLARLGGQTLFFDPIFARFASPVPIIAKRFQAAPAALAQLPPIDRVVITHNHYDHLDRRAIDFFAASSCRFAVPLGMGDWLGKRGIAPARIDELDWWQSLPVSEKVQLHALPSLHYSGRGLFDADRSLCCGYALTAAGEQYYISGDGFYGDGSHFAAIGERFGAFDLAFIENGQYHSAWRDNHMPPEDTVKAALAVRARRFMPIHWGAYALSPHAWNAPVSASTAQARAAGLDSLTPLMGEVFSAQSRSRDWWRDSA